MICKDHLFWYNQIKCEIQALLRLAFLGYVWPAIITNGNNGNGGSDGLDFHTILDFAISSQCF